MQKTSIGIDEVGRGPIAGPVTVCAFATDNLAALLAQAPAPLRDSKKLTAKQRARWMEYLLVCSQNNQCTFAVASVTPADIDTYGISPSIKSALALSLEKLTLDPKSVQVFLDGSLYAPKEYVHQSTTNKGDSIFPIISLASIVAKETRDAYMKRLGEQYPQYGFEQHMGYGTRAHYDAIAQYGTTPHHRISFLKKLTHQQ